MPPTGDAARMGAERLTAPAAAGDLLAVAYPGRGRGRAAGRAPRR
jgi:hypothetical protein